VTYSRCLQDAKFALSNPTSILFVFLEKNLGCLSFLEWLQRFLLSTISRWVGKESSKAEIFFNGYSFSEAWEYY
jgi:hypothetical protein